jgi:hypothetical protein
MRYEQLYPALAAQQQLRQFVRQLSLAKVKHKGTIGRIVKGKSSKLGWLLYRSKHRM